MIKKILLTFSSLILLISLAGCGSSYKKFDAEFSDVFDTHSTIVGYAKNQKEFTIYAEAIYNRLKNLHELYDIYNDYEGKNNLKTINDNAGIKPIKVDSEIIDLLEVYMEAYNETDGAINISMGPVLRLWSGARKSDSPAPPTLEELEKAFNLCKIENVIIDKENKTVFLKEKGMSIDVGAIAKGYSTKLAVEDAKKLGFQSGLVSIGGNVVGIGYPLEDNRDSWTVGVQDPMLPTDNKQNIIDTLKITNESVVSSGGYERYFTYDGKKYNHIINSKTLYPANNFSEVTIIHEDSGIADELSTSLFIMSREDGEKLAAKKGAGVIWIYLDGKIETNDIYKTYSKNFK